MTATKFFFKNEMWYLQPMNRHVLNMLLPILATLRTSLALFNFFEQLGTSSWNMFLRSPKKPQNSEFWMVLKSKNDNINPYGNVLIKGTLTKFLNFKQFSNCFDRKITLMIKSNGHQWPVCNHDFTWASSRNGNWLSHLGDPLYTFLPQEIFHINRLKQSENRKWKNNPRFDKRVIPVSPGHCVQKVKKY